MSSLLDLRRLPLWADTHRHASVTYSLASSGAATVRGGAMSERLAVGPVALAVPADPRQLQTYRVLFLSGADQVYAAANIACASDSDALAEAERLLQWHTGAEVWQGARVVGSISRGKDHQSPPLPSTRR